MNQRENMLSCLKRQGYESVPFEFSLCPSLLEKFHQATGTGAEITPHEYYNFPSRHCVAYKSSNAGRDWSGFYDTPFKEGTSVDEWGIAREPGSDDASFHLTHMRHPMENFDSLEQFQSYPWPVVTDESYAGTEAIVEETHDRGLLAMAGHACSIWETSWYMRGMENLMMDMVTEDEKAVYLLDKVTEINTLRAEKTMSAGCDVLHLGDDIGMQERMMMAPDFWMEWLQPRLKSMITRARKAAPGEVLVMYHSCGFIEPAIEGLIDAGVDILNPVQPECMDFEKIHAEYGDRLSFHATIGTQSTFPHGTPEEMKKTVWRHLDIAGAKGGLMPAPTHLLEPEVPWENIEAFVEACREYEVAGK